MTPRTIQRERRGQAERDIGARAGDFLTSGYLNDNSSRVQELSVALYRLLAQGRPVRCGALAEAIRATEIEVSEVLSALPPTTIEYNGAGEIIAFIGLSLIPTNHEFLVAGRKLYTWCVLDGLFLPQILGWPATLRTSCPCFGETIEVDIEPHRLVRYRPGRAVMSVVAPKGEACRKNLRGAFCRHVNFFASPEIFSQWAHERPDMACLPVPEAYLLARRRNADRYPDIIL